MHQPSLNFDNHIVLVILTGPRCRPGASALHFKLLPLRRNRWQTRSWQRWSTLTWTSSRTHARWTRSSWAHSQMTTPSPRAPSTGQTRVPKVVPTTPKSHLRGPRKGQTRVPEVVPRERITAGCAAGTVSGSFNCIF